MFSYMKEKVFVDIRKSSKIIVISFGTYIKILSVCLKKCVIA